MCSKMKTDQLTLQYESGALSILIECEVCGKTILNKPYKRHRKYCSIECSDKARAIRKRREYNDRKNRAFRILANGSPIVCNICGCPHTEALTIGHIHGDGNAHRKQEGLGSKIHLWVLQTPKEDVLKKVRLECIYCNYYQAINKEYPPVEKRPHWKKVPVDE